MIPVAVLASALAATLWPAVVARLQHPDPRHHDDDDERPIGDPDEDDDEGEEDDDDEDDEEEPWQVRR